MSKIIENKKLADFANKVVGEIVSDDEYKQLRAAFNAERKAADKARYNDSLVKAPKDAYIVTKTWQRNGISLRRGEVVYVKNHADGFGAAMVTRSKSKSAQGFVWTCGMEEVHQHAAKAKDLRGE